MNTHRINKSRCPGCGRPQDAASAAHEESPKEGDFAVCNRCGALLVLGADLELKDASEEQLRDLRRRQPSDYRTLMAWQSSIQAGLRS